jgi:magnesium-transporting ATPase (P-type)
LARCVDRLRTQLHRHGLSEADVERRRAQYGRNELPAPEPPSMLRMLLRQFLDFMIIILLVVGIISLALQGWIEAVVLFLVVICNVAVGFWQERKAERALQVARCACDVDGHRVAL